MKLRFQPLAMLLSLVLAALIGLAGSYLFHLNFWICTGIAWAAVLLNGLVAAWEDRLPGGLLGPKKKK